MRAFFRLGSSHVELQWKRGYLEVTSCESVLAFVQELRPPRKAVERDYRRHQLTATTELASTPQLHQGRDIEAKNTFRAQIRHLLLIACLQIFCSGFR